MSNTVLMLSSLFAATCAILASCATSPAHARPGLARAEPRIEYTVSLPEPQTQMVDMTIHLKDVQGPTLDLRLPVWRPGRYHVLDMAGSVRETRATDGAGNALTVEKADKTTWRVTTNGASEVKFTYRIFASELRTRLRHVDDTHAFLSPSAVFVYDESRRGEPLTVRIEAPEDWRVASGLDPIANDPHVLYAKNYDVLVDSPIEIGEHERIQFDVDGKTHDIVIWGRGDWDAKRLADDFAAIVRAQAAMFGNMPYERYMFIIHSNPGMGGGTEHLNSTVMGVRPDAFGDESRYDAFLGLVSHEMFHTWNVKQLRPAGIHPYDYMAENYTDLLWIAEGTTSYYDDLILARTELIDTDEYFKRLAGSVSGYFATPGRNAQSVAESSFDAWIKFNKPDPDAHNSTVNFYREGALVSLMLDAEVRRRTDNRVSLDTVMRDLYERFPLDGPGFTTQDVLASLERLVGSSFDEFFTRYVSGTDEYPLADALDVFGLSLSRSDDEPAAYIGLGTTDRSGSAAVTRVYADGPAYKAGLNVDDEILAIDGQRVRGSDWDAAMKRLTPGQAVMVMYSRYDLIREVLVTPDERPKGGWRIKQVKDPTDAQKAAYEDWIRIPWDGPAKEEDKDESEDGN
mgnify:CR=1 FL=1